MANRQVLPEIRSARAEDAPHKKKALSVGCALLALGILWVTARAEAQPRVDVGDVIEVVVARIPELQRRVTVRADGNISFPLLGSLAVVGLSPSQLEATIQATLASKAFRMRTADGRETDVLIDRDEVTATVVEYRPIYVSGDVSRPGAHAYRPSMTARQAIALSGGYDVLRGGPPNPYSEALDLEGEYQALWAEFVKEQARVWRIRSELGDKANLDQRTLMDIPLPWSTIAQIVKVETEHLLAREMDYQRQYTFLKNVVARGEEQISVLLEAQEKEEEGVRSDAKELERAVELYGKGSLPSPRVMDARRAVLLSATRKLQTTTQLMQMRRQQDDLLRQMEKLADQRKIELLRELQEAGVKRDAVRTKLKTIGEKLQFTKVRSKIARGDEVKPAIVVFRKSDIGREHLVADEDTELQPGDVIDVAVRLNLPLRNVADNPWP